MTVLDDPKLAGHAALKTEVGSTCCGEQGKDVENDAYWNIGGREQLLVCASFSF